MGFSRAQQSKYRPMVTAAWTAHCAREGLDVGDKGAREAWYRKQLLECVGEYTTKALDQTDDFDQVMLHFAQVAGDDYWMEKLAHGKETRMIYLIGRRLKDLDRLDAPNVHTWAYARAVHDHMGLPADIEDCPAGLLWKVFQALSTHARRLTARTEEIPF
jgi:hypothetical protein